MHSEHFHNRPLPRLALCQSLLLGGPSVTSEAKTASAGIIDLIILFEVTFSFMYLYLYFLVISKTAFLPLFMTYFRPLPPPFLPASTLFMVHCLIIALVTMYMSYDSTFNLDNQV